MSVINLLVTIVALLVLLFAGVSLAFLVLFLRLDQAYLLEPFGRSECDDEWIEETV